MNNKILFSIGALLLSTAVFGQLGNLSGAADKARNWFNQNNYGVENLHAALNEFSDATISKLAVENAFKGDSKIYIPLPSQYNNLKKTVTRFGGEQMVSRIEDQLNAAAEKTIELAKPHLVSAISKMELNDAIGLAGKQKGFTNYLEGKSALGISNSLEPEVKAYLESTGTYNLLNEFFAYYKKFAGFFGRRIPNGPTLESYVAEKAVDGLFLKLGQKEAKFREEKLPPVFNK
ncbi:DUF4197 domain-containing protein [Luteibaculum oceani]|uniref:DUF4197 domain-containing protein n=1 Tax=Luteibaculum oceani TaxID=1294296 RepID=A0A5C6V9V7_9FLAO|nr:DUF4197 domain-containing protein [Luteibaculum oceani]TXC81977.1 DUF4197 domain-containing protein [Luteibaculum oceani]